MRYKDFAQQKPGQAQMTYFNFSRNIQSWIEKQKQVVATSVLGLSADDTNTQTVNLQALEDRVLYSAAPIPVELVNDIANDDVELSILAEGMEFQIDLMEDAVSILESCDDGACDLSRLELVEQQLDESVGGVIEVERNNELVIVDQSVEGHAELVLDLIASGADPSDIVFLDPASDGISQISNMLNGRVKYDAVHLVTHGSDGQIQLGGETLDAESLSEFQDEVSNWSNGLSQDADFLIYGCNVAESEHGEAFIDQLSELTSADFAASDDVTGNGQLGGDWNFEYQVGVVQADIAFSTDVQASWAGTLDLVDAALGSGSADSLAISDNGTVVRTYASDTVAGSDDVDIYYVTSDLTLANLSSEIRINDSTNGVQDGVSVGIADNGNMAFVWTSNHTGQDEVFGKLFDADGTVIKSEFQISNGNEAENATVAMDSYGNFVVAWESTDATDTDGGIFVQYFDMFGNTVGSSLLANSELSGDTSNPDVAINDSNQFVVAWDNFFDSDEKSQILTRRFVYDPLAGSVTAVESAEKQVMNLSLQLFTDPSIDLLDGHNGEFGAYVVSATVDATDSVKTGTFGGIAISAGEGISIAIVDPDNTIDAYVAVTGTHDGDQYASSIVALEDDTPNDISDNKLVVAWEGVSEDETDTQGVYYREYLLDGSSVSSSQFVASSAIAGDQSNVAIAKFGSGTQLAFGFEGVDSGNDGYHVKVENVAPTLDAVVLNTVEDTAYTFSRSDFEPGFDDSDGDAFAGIRVHTLPVGGRLFINGLAASVGDFADVEVLDNGGFVFLPAADTAGTPVTFQFLVSDGYFDSELPSIATFNVSSAADDYQIAAGDELFSVTGGETLVNETMSGIQQGYRVESLANGGYVIAWHSIDNDLTDGDQGTRVMYAVYDENGNAIQSETEVDSDISQPGHQLYPDVIGLQDGGFVVLWHQDNGSNHDVYGQRFDAAGAAVGQDGTGAGSEFLVSQHVDGNQQQARGAALSDGGFVVAWSSASTAIDADYGVAARIFTASGVATDEFLVNDSTSGIQRDIAITALDDNRFVVGWSDQSVNDHDLFAKIYEAGNPNSGTLVDLHVDKADRQGALELETLADGNFVATWESAGAKDGFGRTAFARVFDSIGNSLTGDIQVNQEALDNQENPTIVGLGDGGFVAIWESDRNDTDGKSIVGRRFDVSGLAVGDEFVINSHRAGNQSDPQATLLPNGEILIVWNDADGDDGGSGFSLGVYADRFQFGTTVDEDTAASLNIASVIQDLDGSETVINVVVEGLPTGSILSDGTNSVVSSGTGNGYFITTWDLTSITVTPPLNSVETIEALIRVTSGDGASNRTQESQFVIDIEPVDDSFVTTALTKTTNENSTATIATSELTNQIVDVDRGTTTYPVLDVNASSTTGTTYIADSQSKYPGLNNAIEFDGTGGLIVDESEFAEFGEEGAIQFTIWPDSLVGRKVILDRSDAGKGLLIYQEDDTVVVELYQESTIDGHPVAPVRLVADGLIDSDFNILMLGVDRSLAGDSGKYDVQLFLDGQLKDQLTDIESIDGASNWDIPGQTTGFGQFLGDSFVDQSQFSNFTGLSTGFVVFDDGGSVADAEQRFQNHANINEVISVAGQTYASGTTIPLPSGAQIIVQANADLEYDPNGAFDYLPDGSSTTDTFQYEVTNATGQTEMVDVTITINGRGSGAPTDLSTGIAINTDGGNDAYYLTQDTAMLDQVGDFTVEVAFSSNSNEKAPLISYQTTEQPNGTGHYHNDLLIQYNGDGTLSVYLPGGNGGTDIYQLNGYDYSTLMDGTKHTLAFSFDTSNGNWIVYIDGVLEESGSSSMFQDAELTGGGSLVFGQEQDSPNGDFDPGVVFAGTLYDVRFWDKKFSSTEAVEYLDQDVDPNNLPSNLLAAWEFDKSGDTNSISNVVDSSNPLALNHAAGTDFALSSPDTHLQVMENAANGTVVGIVHTTDPDPGDTFTYQLLDDASGRFAIDSATGEITVNDGTLLDHEDLDSHSINIEVTDSTMLTYNEVFTIQVLDRNESPTIASNAGATVLQNSSNNLVNSSMLFGADQDASDYGPNLTFTLNSISADGDLMLGGAAMGVGSTFSQQDIIDGLVTFDHSSATPSSVSYGLTLSDGDEDGATDATTTLTFSITPVNLAPQIALNTGVTIEEGSVGNLIDGTMLLEGDPDDDGAQVTYEITTDVSVGQLFLDGSPIGLGDEFTQADIDAGLLTYDHDGTDPSMQPVDSFDFDLSDGGEDSAPVALGTFVITVSQVDEAPLAVDDQYATDEDVALTTTLTDGVLSNDSDEEGDGFQVVEYSQAEHGDVVVNADGSFTYTPNRNYNGPDSFEYTLTQSQAGLIHHWGLGADGRDLVGGTTATINGTTSIASDDGTGLQFDEVNDYVEIPSVNVTGDFTISLEFKIDDINGTTYQYFLSHGDQAGANGLSVYLPDTNPSNGGVAGVLRTSVHNSSSGNTVYGGLDVDINSLIGDGAWHTYTLVMEQGVESRVYIDGVLANSSGITIELDQDILLGTRDDFDAQRFFGGGMDSFQIYDQALSETEINDPVNDLVTARVDIDVTPVNDAPILHENIYGVAHGGTTTITLDEGLLYNDWDIEGDTLTATVITQAPSEGSVTLNPNGTFVYDHFGTSAATDSFEFQVTDGNGGFSTQRVEIHIDSEGFVEGNEFLVSTNAADVSSEQSTQQENGTYSDSAVATRANGDYVVTWTDYSGSTEKVFVQRYDGSGTPLGEAIDVGSELAQGENHSASISMSDDGRFVVVWSNKAGSGTSEDGTESSIYYQLFNADGSRNGSATQVNTGAYSPNAQVNADVSMNSLGEFAVVYDGAGPGGIQHDVFIATFDANGNSLSGGPTNMNNEGLGGGLEYNASVVMADDGTIVSVWDDGNAIHGKVFDRTGNSATGAEFITPDLSYINQIRHSSLDMNSAGQLAMAYQIEVFDGVGGTNWETRVQIFDLSNPVVVLNADGNQTFPGTQENPSVSFGDDGTLIMTWQGEGNGGDADGVYARKFKIEYTENGNPYADALGDEFLVNQSTVGSQFGPSVSAVDSENFVVVWNGVGVGDSDGVFARQFGNQESTSISGQVFEDVNGDSENGDAVAVEDAIVRVYRDGGDGVMSSDDMLVRTLRTDSSGVYTATGLNDDSTYWVAVDSKSIKATAGYNGTYDFADSWAEQTFGDGGAKFGGLNAGVSDDASSLLTSQHVSEVNLGSADATFVDFGFSFNVVTNTFGGDGQDDDSAVNDRSVQGSLRQFITNANAVQSGNDMHFVPGVAATDSNGTDSWWEVAVSLALPEISDADTFIDGRAYDSTDGTTLLNSNSTVHTNVLGDDGIAGTGDEYVGVGADGVAGTGDETLISGVRGPDLEIMDVNGVGQGLSVNASDVEIAYVSIHGFGDSSSSSANIYVGSIGDSVYIHDNIFGAEAGDFSKPNTAVFTGPNILARRADNGVVQDNLIGFAGYAGIKVWGDDAVGNEAQGWSITGNQIVGNAHEAPGHDGIDLHHVSSSIVSGNFISGNSGHGIDTFEAVGDITIEDNTIVANGVGGDETGGIRLYGTGNTVLHNVIAGNAGSGVNVVGDYYNGTGGLISSASIGNFISQNSFYDNDGIAIDLIGSTDDITELKTGDGVSENGVAPDINAGNRGLDYPILSGAYIDSAGLHVHGTINSGSGIDGIEIYVARSGTGDAFGGVGNSHGEGAIYIGTLHDSGTLIVDGATGEFSGIISIPAMGWPAELTSGGAITGIAFTDGGKNTSEFGNTETLNDVPNALASSVTTNEDQPHVFDLAEFQVLDSDNSTMDDVVIVTLPVDGTLFLDGVAVTAGQEISGDDISLGKLTFEPIADGNGSPYTDFEFHVSDGLQQSIDPAIMTVRVLPINDAPLAQDDFYSVNEDTTLSVDGGSLQSTLFNDSDVDLDSLTVNTVPVTPPANGTLVLSADGTFEYTPNQDFTGSDSFVYEVSDGTVTRQAQVTINVLPLNDAPVAMGETYSVNEDSTLTVDGVLFQGVLSNDLDVDLDSLTVNTVPVSPPANGTLSLRSDGMFEYEPNPDFAGTDTFVYEVTDGTLTHQATVVINVVAVNDNPELTSITSIPVNENVTNVIQLTSSDVDGGVPLYSIAGGVDSGAFAVDPNTGQLTFVTPPDWTAPHDSDGDNIYSVEILVDDQNGGFDLELLKIEVLNIQEVPTITSVAAVSVLENTISPLTVTATDPDNDTLEFSIVGGNDQAAFSIDPATGELTFNVGPDFEVPTDADGDHVYEVKVRVDDGFGNIDEQDVSITILPENDNDPVVTAVSSVTMTENQTAVTTVSATDSDLPAGSLTFSISGSGTDDALFMIDPVSGELSFISAPDYEAPLDSDGDNVYEVEIRVDDGDGRFATKMVLVSIEPNVPVANDDNYWVAEAGTYEGNLGEFLVNDINHTGMDFDIQVISGPVLGDLNVESDGSFSYVHNGSETMADSFVYQVTDIHGQTDIATVQITVDPVEDATIVRDDQFVTNSTTSITISRAQLLSNDFDIDSSAMEIVALTQPVGGSLIVGNDGDLVFVPDAGFDGIATFTYQVLADGVLSDAATVEVSVEGVVATNSGDSTESESENETEENNNEQNNSEDNVVAEGPQGPLDNDEPQELVGTGGQSGNVNSLADTQSSDSAEFGDDDRLAFELGDLSASYVYASQGVSLALDEVQGTLNRAQAIALSTFNATELASIFWDDLDSTKRDVMLRFKINRPAFAMSVTSALTVGYLAWIVRGGVLLTTFMSSLPAWSAFDPLAVIDEAEGDDESIEQLVN